MTRFFGTFILIYLLSLSSVIAQTVQLDTVAELSYELKEISAMVRCGTGGYWALNDSGNEAELFLLDAKGNIKKKVNILNSTNVDWEELARDAYGNIYIGDFGNNRNDRVDLRIYVVRESELLAGTEAPARAISFTYPDQKAFPPDASKQNFDMEAMVWYMDNLWLFSKNRTQPFTGYTNIYKLPTAPGDYKAEKVDSLYLGEGPRELLQITAADISPDGSLLALLSYDKFYLIHDFPYNDLIGGRIEQIALPELSQRESLTFLDDSTLVVADERSVLGGGNMYQIQIAANRKQNALVRKGEVSIPEKEFGDTLLVEVETEVRGKVYWEFLDGEGNRVSYGVVGEFDRGSFAFNLYPKPFPNGTYLLNIQVGKRPHAFFVYRFTGVDWAKVEKDFKERAEEVQKRQTNEPER